MKKMTRLMSILLLAAMLFSLTSVSAFAASDGNTVVFDEQGTDVTGGSANGNVVISAEDNINTTGLGSAKSSVAETEEAEEITAVEAGSQYSILTTSASALDYFSSEKMREENPMIYNNAKYIVYIREHMDELKATNPDVVETAYALFGAEYMDMKFEATTTVVTKSVALKTQAECLQTIVEKLEVLVANPTDADGVVELRKAVNVYRDTFSGVANYDYTDEESAFSSASEALDAAKAELANITAEIDKIANGNDAQAEEKTESAEEVENQEIGNAGIAAPSSVVSPLKIFASLFALPQVSAASLSGKTTYLSDTVTITGLPDWPIIATLDNAVIYAPSGKYAFAVSDANTVLTIEAATIYGKAIDVSNGNVTLKFVKVIDDTTGDGAVKVSGGQLEIGNCEINSSAEPCVCADGGLTLINGYNKIGASNTDAIDAKKGTVQIDNTDTTQSIISAVNGDGIHITGATVNAYGNAKISGQNGVYVENGVLNVYDNVRIDGIANSNTKAAVNNKGGNVYISGGTLYGEYCYGIITDTSAKTFVANGEDVIVTSKYDCKDMYQTGIITVDGEPCIDVATANGKIKEGSVIELLGDLTSTTGLKIDKSASVNGNGHTLVVDGDNGISVSAGDVSINNIAIEAPNSSCIAVTGGNVNIGDGVIAKTGKYALFADNTCAVNVNGMTLYCENGFNSTNVDAKINVNNCKDNAGNPIASGCAKSGLVIYGGSFLSKGTTGVALVADYVATGISSISEKTNSDGYYVVSMEYVPTVSIVNGTTGTDANGIPYVVYDKANPKYIIFNVDPKVLRIDAVPINGGTTVNLLNKTAVGGVEGDVKIDVDAFQMNIGSGVFDLQFQFKNGYIMTNKLHLYVLPETVKLVARSNYQDASQIAKASDISTAVTQYTVGSKAYIYAEVSELPTAIGVSADATGSEVNWLGYYTGAVDQKKVLQKADSKDYFILVDYAFLDQLSAGQDYIFLDYNGAIKRLDLKIVNNNVKISPTSMDFWGADTSAVFTVTPDYKDVYIDGVLVPTQFVKYDTNTHKLTINGEYLNQLDSGEHLMEVETSLGWLSATIRTGVGLRPVDVDYHVYGGAKALAFMASDKIDTTAGIYIGKNNPTKVDESLIYFYDNNTKFTLSPSYLNRLALGTYYLSAYVWNGEDYEYTSTTFRIVSASSAAYNPGTGDTFSPILWIGIAVLAAAVIVVILIPTLKKKNAVADKVETVEKVPEDKEEK